jgi:hypothetical protein
MSDSEEEITVEVWNHKGKKYLLDPATDDVYDFKEHTLIGRYNPKTEQIESEEERIVIKQKREERQKKKEDEKKKQMEKERKQKEQRMEDDVLEKFEEYKYGKNGRELVLKGWKTIRTNRVYTQLLKPYGMYDPKTRTVDKSTKPPAIEGYEESDEEDLDAMIDALDREIDELDPEDD